MVNRTFKGRRLEWLLAQKPAYEDAVTKATIPSFLDATFARFCRRFPIDLPLDQEPTAEFLAAVDDNAPEPEQETPRDDMDEEEKTIAEAAQRARQAIIRQRRKVSSAISVSVCLSTMLLTHHDLTTADQELVPLSIYEGQQVRSEGVQRQQPVRRCYRCSHRPRTIHPPSPQDRSQHMVQDQCDPNQHRGSANGHR